MKTNNDCDLVYNLLPGYIDKILTDETNEFVKDHLQTCNSCKEKYEIMQDKNFSEKNKYEFDYLKKLKINSTIKAIITPIILIFIIFLIWYLSNFFTINSIKSKFKKTISSENFYIEKYENLLGDDMLLTKTWYKDNHYKVERVFSGDESKYTLDKVIDYGETNNNSFWQIDKTNNKATKINGMNTQKENLFPSLNPIIIGKNSLFFSFGSPFHWRISKDNSIIGRDYYKISSRNSDSEQWVDMETGLPIIIRGYSYSAEYFEGTHIIKNKDLGETEYVYKFDVVTDEDVLPPDLSNYIIEENNTLNDIKPKD